MRLTARLVLGAATVVGATVVVLVAIVNVQLRGRLEDQAVDALARDARSIAVAWERGGDPVDVAKRHGDALGHRVTIITPSGTVVGDTDFDRNGIAGLENHGSRPEVVGAIATGLGVSTRPSPSRGDVELYVAVRTARGVVRVSMPLAALAQRVESARRAVLTAGATALIVALLLAVLLARRLVRPVEDLSDVARRIAAGDRTRRGAIDAPGELGVLSVALADLSTQLAARDAARDAYEALLLELVEALNEGVVGVDANRTVVRLNDTARRLLGVRERVPFSVDLLPRDRVLRDALAAALDGRTAEGAETIIGTTALAVSSRPLGGGGAVVALLDITRMRRLEAVRRDFVAAVSHELRTPLTVIGGFAETLTHADVADTERLEFARRIVFNAQRMQRLVDDLLDLSRIESGGWIPTPTDVDLEAAARDGVADVEASARAKGIALRLDVAADSRTLWADETALRQILRNLLENAVRHTESGEVCVFAGRTGDGRLEFGVRDTGVGIQAEHLPRIFERFYRVDPARSREAGGTGLGLAIVRHLAEAHGWTVRAESAIGVGTRIVLRVPPRS